MTTLDLPFLPAMPAEAAEVRAPVLGLTLGWASGELAKLPVLAIRQPWATSIVHFGKPLENRAWSGRYLALQLGALRRGGNRFLIQASAGMTRDEMQGWRDFVKERGVEPTAEMMAAAGVKTFRDLPRGGIIGVARFVRWVTESDSPWWIGPGALEMTDVQPLAFLPCKGALGFFGLPNAASQTTAPKTKT